MYKYLIDFDILIHSKRAKTQEADTPNMSAQQNAGQTAQLRVRGAQGCVAQCRKYSTTPQVPAATAIFHGAISSIGNASGACDVLLASRRWLICICLIGRQVLVNILVVFQHVLTARPGQCP